MFLLTGGLEGTVLQATALRNLELSFKVSASACFNARSS